MADSVTGAQKKSPAQRARDWVQRLHRWLLTEDTPSAPPPERHVPTTAADAPIAQPAAAALGQTLDAAALAHILWGEGWHLPLGEHMSTVMVRAFGLDSSMGVLDLTAGMGGAARKIASEYQTYVTGLESDPVLVSTGQQLNKRSNLGNRATLNQYDPNSFKAEKRYDGIIARELFFHIRNKKDLVAQIAASLKPQGQVSWTDFVIAESTQPSALAAWQAQEGAHCTPLLLGDVAKLWSIHGLEVRVSEDRTSHYADAITLGLGRLMQNLQETGDLTAESRRAVLAEVERWAQRMVAFSSGLRFYRFHALRR